MLTLTRTIEVPIPTPVTAEFGFSADFANCSIAIGNSVIACAVTACQPHQLAELGNYAAGDLAIEECNVLLMNGFEVAGKWFVVKAGPEALASIVDPRP